MSGHFSDITILVNTNNYEYSCCINCTVQLTDVYWFTNTYTTDSLCWWTCSNNEFVRVTRLKSHINNFICAKIDHWPRP